MNDSEIFDSVLDHLSRSIYIRKETDKYGHSGFVYRGQFYTTEGYNLLGKLDILHSATREELA